MRKLIGIMLVVSALAACASAPASITSNKDADNIRPLGTTYVLIATGDARYLGVTGPKIAPLLADYLTKALRERSIDSKSDLVGELALEGDLQKQVVASGAGTVMSIELSDRTLAHGTLTHGSFTVSVFDMGLKKNVWKARLVLAAQPLMGAITDAQLKGMVDQALEKMKEDGLLLGAAS